MYSISRLLLIVFAVQFCSCKQYNQPKSIVKNQEVLNNLSYEDLLDKTFFVLQEEEGELIYDSYGVNHMTEYIRFYDDKIEHYMPMDEYIFLIKSKENLDHKTLNINTYNEYNSGHKKVYNLQYDRLRHLLYFFDNNVRTVYVDSLHLNSVKNKKYPKKESLEKKYSNVELSSKKSLIILDSKRIELEIPIPKYEDLPKSLMAYLLKGSNGDFLFVTGERQCGECPSFVSTYSIEGELLTYSYKVKKSGERYTIASKGKNSDTFTKYEITNQQINSQRIGSKSIKYEIKNWY